jgi:hypothetical protein
MANDTVVVETPASNGAAAANAAIPNNIIQDLTYDLIEAAISGWDNYQRRADGSFSALQPHLAENLR